jgi:hypothetical protein
MGRCEVAGRRDDDDWRRRSYKKRDGDAGRDDGVAAEVGVGEEGAEDGSELHAAADDVGDLRGVDALDVVLPDEVAAGGHPQPYHAPCTYIHTSSLRTKFVL